MDRAIGSEYRLPPRPSITRYHTGAGHVNGIPVNVRLKVGGAGCAECHGRSCPAVHRFHPLPSASPATSSMLRPEMTESGFAAVTLDPSASSAASSRILMRSQFFALPPIFV